MTPTEATTATPSTPPAAEPNPDQGRLSQFARREIHATLQAELVEARAAFEAAKAEARRKVIERLGIDANTLDDIETEADREGWPDWDGLADERGPIPGFGPMKKDKRGRWTFEPEEAEARREASRRMLRVIGKVTDESDRDEIWDQLPWGREESE